MVPTSIGNEEETGFVPPGLHSKFNSSGLEFLKSSFLRHVHDILEQGIPDGERNVGDTLKFSWSELKCPRLKERDPVLEIVPGEGMKGSIEVDAFSIDGNWGYSYKKGLFRWSDSGTFRLAFSRLRVNLIMSIKIVGPDNQLKLFIKPGNADVEAEDVEIRMRSKGVFTQGIINVALPHIRSMWRKPAELSKKIEENANINLVEIVRHLPISYPLQREVLGTAFHVGNLFQSDFDIREEYCYWELSSAIVPTAYYVDYIEKEEARGKELKGKEKDLKGGKMRFQHVRRTPNRQSENSPQSADEPLIHPFSPSNFQFPQPKVPKMTVHPKTCGSDNHISYCLSEFTLNTFASSAFDLGLCESLITEWEDLPGYLQRYICTFCRKEPSAVHVEAKLLQRPIITMELNDVQLAFTGWITVAAYCELSDESMEDMEMDSIPARPARPGSASALGLSSPEEIMDWTFFHKTRHDLRFRVIPRVDKDFVIKFAFEKIDCTSDFEQLVSKTSGLRERTQPVKESAKSMMISIVENMVIVELLPRIYEVGEVGIPLTINDGCLFEPTEILSESKALIVSGFMRLKEFAKKPGESSNADDDGEEKKGEEEREEESYNILKISGRHCRPKHPRGGKEEKE